MAQILLQLLAAEQEIAGLLQPTAHQRPHPQQRFVGHLHRARLTLALALHQQPRSHQRLQQRPSRLRQRVPGGRAAGVAALLAHPHHRRHKGLPQCLEALLIRPLGLQHPIGRLLHRILQRRMAGGRIPQGLVDAQGEHPFTADLLMQAAQGEGQQGQGVFRGGVVDGPLNQRWLHLQASHPRRAFDDLPVTIQGEGPQRQGIQAVHQLRQRLQSTHRIGPDRDHRLKRQRLLQHRRQHGHKPIPLRWLGHREQFLRLIDRQQQLGLRRAGRQTQIRRPAGNKAGQGRCLCCGEQPLMQLPPAITSLQGKRQRLGQALEGPRLRSQHRQHKPLPACTPQPRQHPRPQQGRLARPRRAQQHQEPRPSLHPACVEPLDHGPPVVIATEEHRSVFRLKHHQAREGGAVGITIRRPEETTLILQGDAHQLAPQLLQARLPVVAQIEALQICRDRLFGVRLIGLHHLEDRFAQGARLGEFGKAPAGSTPVRRLQNQQGLAALDLLVERALPIRSSGDAVMFVEIKKCRLKPLVIQPALQLCRRQVVTAGMGEEDAGHGSGACGQRVAIVNSSPRTEEKMLMGNGSANNNEKDLLVLAGNWLCDPPNAKWADPHKNPLTAPLAV